MPILLVDPDPMWPLAFERAREEVLTALGTDRLLGFEHIGSTSVTGLAAKPLIDMLASVRDLDEVASMVEPIVALGYDYLEELISFLPGRRLFARPGGESTMAAHLHIVVHGREHWTRHLDFRDWLRAHPADRDAYQALKMALAARHDDTKDYSVAKTSFVRRIEAMAAASRE